MRTKRKLTMAMGAAIALAPYHVLAQTSMADPQGSGVIISAVNWLQGTLLGTVATVAAVIAVACVGFMMLTGRINWRHGAVVIRPLLVTVSLLLTIRLIWNWFA